MKIKFTYIFFFFDLAGRKVNITYVARIIFLSALG